MNTTPDQIASKATTSCDLWVGKALVLTVGLDKATKGCPADPQHIVALSRMVQGLARAQRAVAFQAENDTSNDASFLVQPIEDIADAIVLLMQLSDAVQETLAPRSEVQ